MGRMTAGEKQHIVSKTSFMNRVPEFKHPVKRYEVRIENRKNERSLFLGVWFKFPPCPQVDWYLSLSPAF